jgi:formylglycine-generating enzyme required for sulfatase activity
VALKTPQPEFGAAWVVPDLDLAMVAIAPGSFVMGSPASEPGRFENEVLHPVRLTDAYWLGKYEMTQTQYERVVGTNPSYFRNVGNDAPVENLSWEDAMDFCRKLNERERKAGRLPGGYEYTLPSEAQREYACRAGGTDALSDNLGAVGWYKQNSGDTTHPVGEKEANRWGLHDMYGNVWEWCRDWYDDYPSDAVTDPEGPPSGAERVNRGGGWESVARSCRPAVRHYSLGPGFRSNFIGFRLALSPVAAK